MTATGYVRVSTEDLAKEGVSLDNQKSKIVAYCQLKGLELSEIIEDAGIDALETIKLFDKWGMPKLITTDT
jgi:site-specific DNA recombinase